MAKKKLTPPDLAELLPPVLHLPVRSLPFNEKWLTVARERWLELKAMGVDQKKFAAWCGCVQGSWSNVIKDGGPLYWRTEYLERFSLALGIPLPLRAQFDIEGDSVGENEENLAKVLEIVRWARSQAK